MQSRILLSAYGFILKAVTDGNTVNSSFPFSLFEGCSSSNSAVRHPALLPAYASAICFQKDKCVPAGSVFLFAAAFVFASRTDSSISMDEVSSTFQSV